MSYGRTKIYSDAREITAANVVEKVSNAKCEESPCFYRGKVLDERSYTKSLDNFDAYVSEWKGEPNGMDGTPPFSIKSFLIFPSDCMESFEEHLYNAEPRKFLRAEICYNVRIVSEASHGITRTFGFRVPQGTPNKRRIPKRVSAFCFPFLYDGV